MRKASLIFLLSLSGLHGAALANGAVEAGAMLSNTESLLSAREVQSLEGLPPEFNPRLRWGDEFSVRVGKVVVIGNHLLHEDKLQEAVKGFIGKRIPVESVSRLARAVAKAYRDAGHKVVAYIPDQSFSGQQVLVQVIEPPSSAKPR
jgi:hemolysin activation/secretion protein